MNITDIEWEREMKGKRERHGKEVSRDFLRECSRKKVIEDEEIKFFKVV